MVLLATNYATNAWDDVGTLHSLLLSPLYRRYLSSKIVLSPRSDTWARSMKHIHLKRLMLR